MKLDIWHLQYTSIIICFIYITTVLQVVSFNHYN